MGDADAITSFLGGGTLASAAGPIRSPFPETVAPDLANDADAVLDHAFVMAAGNGQISAARRLLTAGARINGSPPGFHWNGTALHAAVWRGDEPMVRWLLAEGADSMIEDGSVGSNAMGGHNTTAIHTWFG